MDAVKAAKQKGSPGKTKATARPDRKWQPRQNATPADRRWEEQKRGKRRAGRTERLRRQQLTQRTDTTTAR